MSHLLDSLLDPERRAACQGADDAAISQARDDARRARPFWPFAPLTPAQARNCHPANAAPTRPAWPRRERRAA